MGLVLSDCTDEFLNGFLQFFKVVHISFSFQRTSIVLGSSFGFGLSSFCWRSHNSWGLWGEVCSFEAEDLFLISDGASGRAGGAVEA